ncbi:MAG TPA: transposase [Patescibacteria group bacterium]|nr:transposase [Patescibacteria group bacterium]
MPSKYLLRNFEEDGIYHVFNRGVDKRNIFQDDADYELFLYYLYIYLTPLEKVLRRYHNLPIRLFQKNLAKQVDLLAYCLMPNHFHLLVMAKDKKGISQFMKQLSNAYTHYFNQKYQRSGALFEGAFKSVGITSDEGLMHTARYIHLNPVVGGLSTEPEYHWSSYNEYIDESQMKLCHTKLVLDLFASVYAFKKFTHDQKDYAKKLSEIKNLTIE